MIDDAYLWLTDPEADLGGTKTLRKTQRNLWSTIFFLHFKVSWRILRQIPHLRLSDIWGCLRVSTVPKSKQIGPVKYIRTVELYCKYDNCYLHIGTRTGYRYPGTLKLRTGWGASSVRIWILTFLAMMDLIRTECVLWIIRIRNPAKISVRYTAGKSDKTRKREN